MTIDIKDIKMYIIPRKLMFDTLFCYYHKIQFEISNAKQITLEDDSTLEVSIFILIDIVQHFPGHFFSFIRHIHALPAQHAVDSGFTGKNCQGFTHPLTDRFHGKCSAGCLIGIIQ